MASAAPRLPQAPQQQLGAPPPPPQPSVNATLAGGLGRVMKLHWGHDSFRPLQAEAVVATLSGKDVLIILPTGGGKSLAFQLAPLYRNQICVVVTPLLALAKDQVNGCLERGIEAASWSSETPENVKDRMAREILADLEDTSLRLLYTTPESLQMERLRELLKTAHEYGKLCSFAIDEAHCVSEWGHDFRPAYLGLGDIRADFKELPFIAATATATSSVKKSIIECLKLRSPVLLHGSFNRPNIAYEVRYKELLGDGSREAALQDLLAFLDERRGQCGIIYARLRATCDWLAGQLGDADVECAAYHAGKDSQQRGKIQSGWSEGDYDVVVATIAFGMGIDKANVRFVVHWDPPASTEGLYQESGRAGRDGAPSTSLLYASNRELKDAKKMERGARQGAVGAVAAYIQEPRCRRRALLSYFGEKRTCGCSAAAGEQICDFCRNPKAVVGQLAAVERKLEAAAEDEAAAAAAGAGGREGQPWWGHKQQQHAAGADQCDPGSGGKPQKRQGAGSSTAGGAGSDCDGSAGGSKGGGRCDGSSPAKPAAADPFSTARTLAHRPGARTAAAAAAGSVLMPPRSAPQPRTGARLLPVAAGGAAAAAAGVGAGGLEVGAAGALVARPRPPLKPLLPNRLKRPISAVVPAAEAKQQQQQEAAERAVEAAAKAQPASPAGSSAPAGGAADASEPAVPPGSNGGLGATHAGGSGTGGGAGGGRKPVFRSFKPPRKAEQA